MLGVLGYVLNSGSVGWKTLAAVAPRDAKLGWELTMAKANIVGDPLIETAAQSSRPILEISDLSKTYRVGDEHNQVLVGISLQVSRGSSSASSGRPGPASPRSCAA